MAKQKNFYFVFRAIFCKWYDCRNQDNCIFLKIFLRIRRYIMKHYTFLFREIIFKQTKFYSLFYKSNWLKS